MIDKQEMRSKFSSRLHEALDEAGIRKHGRGSDILKMLSKNKVFKTAQAVSKWLNGGAIPESDSMVILSEWLQVRREWLEYGIIPKKPFDSLNPTEPSNDCHRLMGKVPIISWTQASSWNHRASALVTELAQDWIYCPVQISKLGYALRVSGDSMTNLGPGRSYPDGCIIYVDPEIQIFSGDRVIAKTTSSPEATFKVFAHDAGKCYLKPINLQYPTIEIDCGAQLCGKVIGLFIKDT